jgi:hypothetical protein
MLCRILYRILYRILRTLLFFGVLPFIQSLHLSRQQMYSARGILMHPGATEFHKTQIQNVLYVAYEKWAIKQAVLFKGSHYYLCRDISIDELVLAGKWGLFKSTTRYNGRSTFISYAEIYVRSELFRFMNSRLKGKKIGVAEDPEEIESTTMESLFPSRLDYLEGLNVDAATKRMFALKFDQEKQKPRSNARIAELMCCSEETVRKSLAEIYNQNINGI